MDRFTIPATVANLITVAQAAGTIDALDLYALATKHADSWFSLAAELCEIAFTQRHTGDSHSKVVKAAEKVWAEFGKTTKGIKL